jgi:integrase
VYSDADIIALMAATGMVRSPQRAATYETLIGLLAVTGMRLGEAMRLDGDHIDWDEGIVTVWNSKFRKSRAVPLHSSSLDALRRYAQLRDRCFPRPSSPSFFLSTTGTRLDARVIHKLFPTLVQKAGLEQRAGRRPRLHDYADLALCRPRRRSPCIGPDLAVEVGITIGTPGGRGGRRAVDSGRPWPDEWAWCGR